MRYQRAESPALLNGHDPARRFFMSCFRGDEERSERLVVAHVDSLARCIHVEQYSGNEASVGLPTRNIVANAARLGSAGVILAHNHPSGDATPSAADCRATRALAMAAETIDLAVIDHLIFGGDDCRSMRRMGLL